MRTIQKFTFLCFLLPALLPMAVYGQTEMSKTSLALALDDSRRDVVVTSATGISEGTVLMIDAELQRVVSVDGTRLTVIRGRDGGVVSSHAAGATVWFGPPEAFSWSAPTGACVATAQRYLPRVVAFTGQVFDCVDGLWVELQQGETATRENVGTAEEGVTATEYGTSRHRVTRLTFSGLTLGASTGAADAAFGELLYTLPAGAVVVKAAHMNVALTGSGETCDADTPDMGLGTTVGSGNVATLNLVASGAAENILTGQTVNNLTGTAEVKTVGDQVLAIEPTGDHTVYLNVADGWAGACTVTATGTVAIEWTLLQ